MVLNHKEIAKKYGIPVIFGCRIPSLLKIFKKEENVDDVKLSKIALRDPEVRFFLSCGFAIIGYRRGYFIVDRASLGYGVIIRSI